MQYVASRVGAVLLGLVMMAAAADVEGQAAMISGFISDASSGEVLSGANIVLRSPDGTVTAGATTNDDGLYVLAGLEGGRYELSVSYVGYHAYIDTLQLEANETRTLNITLIPAEVDLEEVTVEAERQGAATTGGQTIRPEDIDRVPAPDVTGDLASYLTTLPGIVALGDRGGQLFIRGESRHRT